VNSSLFALMHVMPASRFRMALLGSLAMTVVAGAPLSHAAQPDPGAGSADQAVTIAAFAFAPAELSVPVGTTLTWANAQDGVLHTTTSTDGVWDSGPLSTGGTFPVTFDQTGDFAYICEIHPSMHGIVHVIGDATSQSATDAAATTATAPTASATPTAQTTVVPSTPTAQATVLPPTPTPSTTPRRPAAPTTPTATPVPYYGY